jgi:glutamate transport system permease protein
VDYVFEHRADILDGFLMTIRLTLVAGVASMAIGTLLAVLRVGPIPPLRWLGATYVTIVRNTPLTLVFVFVTFGLPRMGIRLEFVTFATIALTVYTSAFVCEAVRSGVGSVASGEVEAARAIGLRFGQTMRFVVLPQAIRAVVAPLGGVFNALLKNTSVAVAFSVVEANSMLRRLQNANGAATWPLLITTALGYMLLAAILFGIVRLVERRLAIAR